MYLDPKEKPRCPDAFNIRSPNLALDFVLQYYARDKYETIHLRLKLSGNSSNGTEMTAFAEAILDRKVSWITASMQSYNAAVE